MKPESYVRYSATTLLSSHYTHVTGIAMKLGFIPEQSMPNMDAKFTHFREAATWMFHRAAGRPLEKRRFYKRMVPSKEEVQKLLSGSEAENFVKKSTALKVILKNFSDIPVLQPMQWESPFNPTEISLLRHRTITYFAPTQKYDSKSLEKWVIDKFKKRKSLQALSENIFKAIQEKGCLSGSDWGCGDRLVRCTIWFMSGSHQVKTFLHVNRAMLNQLIAEVERFNQLWELLEKSTQLRALLEWIDDVDISPAKRLCRRLARLEGR